MIFGQTISRVLAWVWSQTSGGQTVMLPERPTLFVATLCGGLVQDGV